MRTKARYRKSEADLMRKILRLVVGSGQNGSQSCFLEKRM